MESTTASRDTLYRSLYLRREFAALQARAAVQTEEQEKRRLGFGAVVAPEPSVSSAPLALAKSDATTGAASASVPPPPPLATPTAIPLDDLRDIVLLPPVNAFAAVRGGSDGEAASSGLRVLSASPVSNSGVGGGGGVRGIGDDPMLREECGWAGLVFIGNLPSPWYNGCFPFTVYFPSRYPFEAPIIELSGPLRSHPHVQEGRVRDLEELGVGALGASTHTIDAIDTPVASSTTKTSASSLLSANKRYFIPFEDVYCSLDPMRVSVLSRVLQHVKRFFYPTEWPPAWQHAPSPQPPSSSLLSSGLHATTSPTTTSSTAAATGAISSSTEPYVNRMLARRDVDRRSATQEVVLGKPFVDYLGTDVLQYFLTTWEQRTESGRLTPFPSIGADEQRADAEDEEKEATAMFASWYNRSVLPHVLALP